jgi:hypothetical protein
MPGTAVEQVEAQDLAERRHLNRVIATADVMAASSLVRKDLRGKPEDVRAIAITLDQMGIPPGIMNINAGFVVNGRVDFMTKIWTALAQRGGYKVWPDDASDSEQGIAWIRDNATGEEHRVTFTWEDATKAGLVGSDTYKRYGRDMLIWRAMARAVRWHAPEVVAGMVEFDEAPVARPRPRPIPERPQVDTEEDIVDGEIVEQGEDIVLKTSEGAQSEGPPGHNSPAAPSGQPAPADRDNAVEPETVVVGSAAAPGDWPALAKHHGVTIAGLLRKAREFAGARALPLPASIEEVTDEQVVADVMDWLGE